MKKVIIFIFLGFPVLFSCQQKTSLNNILLYDLAGESIKLDSLLNPNCSVVIFFSPECPLSENYTLTTNNLYQKYNRPGIQFLGIIPGKLYDIEEIRKFRIKYDLKFSVYLDKEKELTKHLGATITPECYVINENNKVIYHGAIDNWAVDLGKKRTVVTEHYLNDAIQYVLNDKPFNHRFVEAVGCYIE